MSIEGVASTQILFGREAAPSTGTVSEFDGLIKASNAGTDSTMLASASPRLLVGRAAQESAQQIARQAWQPKASERLSAEFFTYQDLSGTIQEQGRRGRVVLATYGEIIFVGPPGKNTENITNAIKKIESTPTGKKMLTSLAAQKGYPIVVFIDDKHFNAAKALETPGASTRYRANYDSVYWDPTSAGRNKKGGMPAWIGLAHELRHVQQMEERRQSTISPDRPDGYIPQLLVWARTDSDRNGIIDIEDDATAFEVKLSREAGLKPIRTTYDEPVYLIREKDALSVPAAGGPTDVNDDDVNRFLNVPSQMRD
jgi:hypothetical protein